MENVAQMGKSPALECNYDPPGYLLREAREATNRLAPNVQTRGCDLACSHPAGESPRPSDFISNPTLEFVREWARALGQNAVLEFGRWSIAGATVGAIPTGMNYLGVPPVWYAKPTIGSPPRGA